MPFGVSRAIPPSAASWRRQTLKSFWASVGRLSFQVVPAGDPIETLLEQRKTLIGRLEQEREQLGQLRKIVEGLEERVTYDECLLSEIESVLGNVPQLSIEDADVRLRGRRLFYSSFCQSPLALDPKRL